MNQNANGDAHGSNIKVLDAILYAGFLYLLLHPTKLDDWSEALQNQWEQFKHRISVEQALAAIRSLPEI